MLTSKSRSRHPAGRQSEHVPVKRTILVVEDERDIRDLLRFHLEQEGYTVREAETGEEALKRAEAERPALIHLDIMLPGADGLEVCRRLRAGAGAVQVPIIMLTAKAAEVDRVLGLEIGADDYITKPFSPRELVARVRAVLRRSERATETGETFAVGDLLIDVPRMRTEVDGHAVELTSTEFSILATMARQPGRVFTRSQLLDAVRGVAFESYERAIDTHIKNIRRKIEPEPREPRYLLTVYGVGYRLAEPAG